MKVIGIISQMYPYMILDESGEIMGYSESHCKIEYSRNHVKLKDPIMLNEDEYILEETTWN